MTTKITDNVYGCLIGGAIGDALGAPVEGWTHERIQEEYGTLEEFKQYYMPYSKTEPGTITSDTALRQYLCLAIVENSGRVTPVEFADVLQKHLNPDRVWINEEIALKKLIGGIDPWKAGRGSVPDNKMTSAITPVGIVNAGDPVQAYQDGYNLASVLQDGHYRHATATIAAGIAEAITPEATTETVITTMMEQSTGIITRGIDIAVGYAEVADTVGELIDILYDTFLDWRWPAVQWDRQKYKRGEVFSASTLETVPVAIAILLICGGEINRSIIEGVNYGRDSDAVATVVGSLAGALHGADEIRSDWKSTCEEMNRDFFVELEDDQDADFQFMAERLVNVIRAERDKHTDRAEQLSQLLEG
ncbi:ADP-ribosylglycohydrolase family protein [Halomontanus rarus]|uniref:ADP-ribosylglycohydrolase family protein n=1 Tax=Halomontanus rarus TaxID=3034020 RepID=UPI0023E80068|nr:ADP-ribosylglycohydrolase family protein [Halovivax sp. TS33]